MLVPGLLNMVCMSVASAPGTGSTISLGSVSTSSGFGAGVLDFASAGAVNGVAYRYVINDGNNREEAWGIYSSSGPSITRNTIIASVNGVVQTTPISASASAIIGSMAGAQDIVTPASLYGGFINALRNPGFDVAQRGTSGTVASGSTSYGLDGWQIAPTGATASWSQQWSANIAGNALRISCASGLTACNLQQRIESYVAAARLLTNAIGSQPLLFQVAIYNNTGATLTVSLATGYASARDNFGTVTGDLAATSLTTIANGTLGVINYVFSPSTSLTNGYQVQLQFGGGLNASSGYVDIGQADLRVAMPWMATGIQNYVPPPELRPLDRELLFCQRYFFGFTPGVTSAPLMLASPTALSDSLGISNGLGISDGLGLNYPVIWASACGADTAEGLNAYGNSTQSLSGSVSLDGSISLTGSVSLATWLAQLKLPARMRTAPTGITVSSMNGSPTFNSASPDTLIINATSDLISTSASTGYLWVTGGEL